MLPSCQGEPGRVGQWLRRRRRKVCRHSSGPGGAALIACISFSIHTPLSITAICVAAVVEHGLVPWAGAALGIGAILLMIPAARLGARWGEQSRLDEEAIAKAPRPRRCDRCHQTEP